MEEYLRNKKHTIPRAVDAYLASGKPFSCAKIDLRGPRDREVATLDEKSTSDGIAEHYALKS